MIFRTFNHNGNFDSEELRQVCFPSSLNDDDVFAEWMISQPYSIMYNPHESFEIISSEIGYDGIFGYILITNDKIPNQAITDKRQYCFHCIDFIELDNRLVNSDWIEGTFQDIFSKIIKYNLQDNKKEIVWMTYKNKTYSMAVYKDVKSILSASHYFAGALLTPQKRP